MWSEHNPNKKLKGNIKLSLSKIRGWVSSKSTKIAYCENQNKELLGYAFCIQEKVKDVGCISWVTQLVVHKYYRNKGIAKKILRHFWNFAEYRCCGLLTANPYAVRALEKTTRRLVIPKRIKSDSKKNFCLGKEHIFYLKDVETLIVNDSEAKINTYFFVSHSDVPEMMTESSKDNAWLLGSLEEGWEWFAFTFFDQDIIKISKKDMAEMLKISDQITQKAYSKMQFDSHRWTKETNHEVDYIIKKLNIDKKYKVLDVGCATGRHTARFAELGYDVTGIDYSDDLIEVAKKKHPGLNFKTLDFRKLRCTKKIGKFDVILLLYDIIGSFANKKDDAKIVKQIRDYLNKNGIAVITVMNQQYIKHRGVKEFSFKKNPDKIYEIPLSDAMNKTGEVFAVENILWDSEEEIAYRRERFNDEDNPSQIPEELLVRDNRYSKSKIENLFRPHFEIVESKFVNLGKWDKDGDENNSKEILLIVRKNQTVV